MTENKESDLSYHLESMLTELATETDNSIFAISQLDEETLQIEAETYKIVVNYREGFDLQALQGRYQDYFEKFDYIVGDWGYDQLRLKGFYHANRRKHYKNHMIDQLDLYLKEYCNFGCRYFVIAKESVLEKAQPMGTKKKEVGVQRKRPVVTRSKTEDIPKVEQGTPSKNRKNSHKNKKSKNKKHTAGNFQMNQPLTKKQANNEEKKHKKQYQSVQKGKHFVIKQPSK